MYLLSSVWSPWPSSTCISHSIKYDHPSLKMRCCVLSCVYVFSHLFLYLFLCLTVVSYSLCVPSVCPNDIIGDRMKEKMRVRTGASCCDTQLLLLLNCHCRRFFLHIFPRFSVFSPSNSLLCIYTIYVRINAHASAIRIHCQPHDVVEENVKEEKKKKLRRNRYR